LARASDISLLLDGAVGLPKQSLSRSISSVSPIARQSPEIVGRSGTRVPKRRTGVPNKDYRGPQQGSLYVGRPLTRAIRTNKPKTPRPLRHDAPPLPYRGARQGPPGSPTRTTGVPSKKYRGARQKPPGSPTRVTGVPDKNHRGPQQAALTKGAAKRGIPGCVLEALCFCFSCSVMLLNNNYRENREDNPWGPIASS
jgi:hypothetical protein